MNWALVEQLKYTFRAATQDAAIKGIVFAAVGNTFLPGVDIEFFARNLERGDLDRIVNFTRAAQELFNEIAACPKPVIAQVQGAAFGGGLELTLEYGRSDYKQVAAKTNKCDFCLDTCWYHLHLIMIGQNLFGVTNCRE
jgi:1,4-dihydroxy-2-naphthoyl-CoA synthase